ncbi:tyrosine--tRNA ligase [bacterium]|nr:tyrosine--tRNA ligase [bacterium]
MNILDDLQYRGLIYQVSNKEGLKKLLQRKKVVLYCGFDPTAGSLHIGNLLPLITLKRFQLAGHCPIVVLGGATGLIGDPSGKSEERKLNSPALVRKWGVNIKKQVQTILGSGRKKGFIRVVNNYDWLGKEKIISFLRDIGKHFTVPYMLAKESVKTRLKKGISFTEFSYMALQAYDFLYLYQKYNCQLQIGGSDQWGNITAGVDLIRKKLNKEVFGLTLPLIIQANGKKFGKTEKGTIWLDSQRTSPYQFYQFWINTDDRDVINFLYYFTFLSLKEIEDLEEATKKHPEKRLAQKRLAQELTSLVHGKEKSVQAQRISEKLFSGDIRDLKLDELKIAFQDVPSFQLKKKKQINLVDLIVKAGIEPSKRQAKEDISAGAISLNGEKVRNIYKIVDIKERLYNKYLIIKKGKKKYYLIYWN